MKMSLGFRLQSTCRHKSFKDLVALVTKFSSLQKHRSNEMKLRYIKKGTQNPKRRGSLAGGMKCSAVSVAFSEVPLPDQFRKDGKGGEGSTQPLKFRYFVVFFQPFWVIFWRFSMVFLSVFLEFTIFFGG